MPWGIAPTFSLVIPSDAGPNDPQIDIGSDIPANLTAYYATFGLTVVNGTIYRYDATQYNYTVLCIGGGPGNVILATGACDSTGTVIQATSIQNVPGQPSFTIGEQAGAYPPVTVSFIVQQNVQTQFSGIFDWTPGAAGIDFLMQGISHPRGTVGFGRATANSAGIVAPASAVIVSTNAAVTFREGRAYRFTYTGSHFSSAAGILGQYSITRAGGGGFALGLGNGRTEGGASTAVCYSKEGVRAAGAGNLTDTVEVTLAALAGTVTAFGSAAVPRHLIVEDVGEAAAFTGATAIT